MLHSVGFLHSMNDFEGNFVVLLCSEQLCYKSALEPVQLSDTH